MEQQGTSVFGRVWHPKSTEPVWAGSARTNVQESDLTYIKANRDEFHRLATTALSRQLLGLSEDG